METPNHAVATVERMYDVREVAALLGIDERTVWRTVQAGLLRKPVKNGKLARWFESDIAECQQRMRDLRTTEERTSK
jgi:predicted DNA-binding transcriptional regulator AlpA